MAGMRNWAVRLALLTVLAGEAGGVPAAADSTDLENWWQGPVRYIAGIPSPMKAPENVDMVVFRENTEDVYIGYEWEADSPMAKKLID